MWWGELGGEEVNKESWVCTKENETWTDLLHISKMGEQEPLVGSASKTNCIWMKVTREGVRVYQGGGGDPREHRNQGWPQRVYTWSPDPRSSAKPIEASPCNRQDSISFSHHVRYLQSHQWGSLRPSQALSQQKLPGTQMPMLLQKSQHCIRPTVSSHPGTTDAANACPSPRWILMVPSHHWCLVGTHLTTTNSLI